MEYTLIIISNKFKEVIDHRNTPCSMILRLDTKKTNGRCSKQSRYYAKYSLIKNGVFGDERRVIATNLKSELRIKLLLMNLNIRAIEHGHDIGCSFAIITLTDD